MVTAKTDVRFHETVRLVMKNEVTALRVGYVTNYW